MTANGFITPNERALSGALALVMHALFFALLVSRAGRRAAGSLG